MVTDKKKTKSPLRSDEVREELVRELKHLRGAVREAGENFILRREGEIETIIGLLATIPATPLKTEAPDWLHEIRELKLKPAKGRLKDLKELDVLIEELADRVMIAQDGKKSHILVRKAR
jgi:hypothetical protein